MNYFLIIIANILGFGLAYFAERKAQNLYNSSSKLIKYINYFAFLFIGIGFVKLFNELLRVVVLQESVRVGEIVNGIVIFILIIPILLFLISYVIAEVKKIPNSHTEKFEGVISTNENEEHNQIFNTPSTALGIINSSSYTHNLGNELSNLAKYDEQLWEVAIDEYDSELRKKGLYAKIYSQKYGDESLIKAEYIKERFEQLKREEIEKIKVQNKIAKEFYKNQSAEDSIKNNIYKIKKLKGIDYLVFENGQAAIKINDSKFRLYENYEALEKSIKYYLSSNMYLTAGLIRIIDIDK